VNLDTTDTATQTETEILTQQSSETAQAFEFVAKNWAKVLLASAVILIPCLWHRHIEAGDLGSHTFNSWLAELIQQGRVPGLYIAHQWNNIAVDWGMGWLGPRLSFAAAEKIVVSICVLAFFWGAFAFVTASIRRAPWMVVPAIAIIAYGFTFYAGFMNFYLSMGFAFFAAAVTWRAAPIDWLTGAILAAMSLLVHPMGFGLLIAVVLYIHVAEPTPSKYRWLVFGSALLCVVAIHFALPHFFRMESWRGSNLLALNGSDQMVLFRPAYKYLALATVVFGCGTFAWFAACNPDKEQLARRVRTPIELWTILVIAAPMVPAAIWLPEYTAAVSAISSRITTLTAILGICVLGALSPRRWTLAGLSVIALIFFGMQYHDTAVLSGMEQQVDTLVAGLPYGSKVSYTIDFGGFSRINSRHLVDRACIGHCFTFSNYEPGSKQFRVRLSPGGSSIVSPWGFDLEHGDYVVRAQDLPLYQIYQPDDADLTKLAIRSLTAGEENGRIGHHQPMD
jgi:hypothetical protein